MLLSLRNEVFSSMVSRKGLEIARRIKEKYAYVALDFEKEVALHGRFEREKIDVMKFHRPHITTKESDVPGRRLDMSASSSSYSSSSSSSMLGGEGEGIQVNFRTRLPNGEELVLPVGRERFHTAEILFTPEIYPETKGKVGLVELIMQALGGLDRSDWPMFLQHVMVAGQSTRLPGFVSRLTAELKTHLSPELASCLKVQSLEQRARLVPESGGEEGNDDPDDANLPSAYTTAVSRGVVGVVNKIVAAQESWLDEDGYREKGPDALESYTYNCGLS
jgi:hypothetical protein